mgnify:FL=1
MQETTTLNAGPHPQFEVLSNREIKGTDFGIDISKDMQGLGMNVNPIQWRGRVTIEGVENGYIIRKGEGMAAVAQSAGDVAAFFITSKEELEDFLLNFRKQDVLDLLGVKTAGTATVAKKKKGKKNAY